MSADSSVAIIYSSDGYQVSFTNGTNSALLFGGISDLGKKFIKVRSDGYQLISGGGSAGVPDYGVITVQGVTGMTPIRVDGTVNAAQSGSWIVKNQDGYGNNLVALPSSPIGAELGLIVRNIPSGNQTISGIVSATQSGTWIVQPGDTANTVPWLMSIHDGTTKATVRDLASSDALNVAIVDGSGAQITSFGGGAQYTEGDTDSSITGTALMLEGAGNTLVAAPGTVADGLLVNLGGNNDVTITGSVTVVQPTSTNLLARVDNAGTFAVQESQVVTDNSPFADGATKLFISGYVFDEVAATSLAENDVAAARINANRAVIHVLEDGYNRGRYATVTTSNALKVDGSSVTQPTSSTQLPSALVSGRLPVVQDATGILANGAEISVTGSATSILAANSSRKSAIIQNTGVANIRVGVSGVTSTTGVRLTPGGVLVLEPPFVPTQQMFAISEGVNSVALAMEIT